MPFKKLSLALLAFLAAASLAPADIMVLKDGKRLEGNILGETPDSVRMKYRLTEKIWDEKEFPRSDIAEIIRQTPSEVALKEQKLKELLPTKDLMSADEYERLIQDRLRPFVNQFAGTPEAAEVEQIIRELQAEKEKVVSGQLKVDNKWLSPEEVKRDDFDIRALRLLNEFKALAGASTLNDFISALRVYDRFIDPATGYIASTHYVPLVKETMDVLNRYEKELLRMIREQPILLKNQEDGVKRLVSPDKERTEAKIKSDYDNWKSNYEAEKRSRIRWLTPYKLDAASLTEAHRTVVAEKAKLSLLNLEELAKQNESLVAVFRYLADGNPVEATAALSKAKELIGNNPAYSPIFQNLQGKISTLSQEIQRKNAAQRSFNQGTTAIGGSTGPIMDERVAKAMADAQAPKQPEPAEDPAAPIGAPAQAAPSAPAPTPAPAPPPPPPAPSAVAEEEGGFPVFILIGGLALLAVLVTAMLLQKKKQKQQSEE